MDELINESMNISACVTACLSVCRYLSMMFVHVCMSVCMHACMHACVYPCIQADTCVWVDVNFAPHKAVLGHINLIWSFLRCPACAHSAITNTESDPHQRTHRFHPYHLHFLYCIMVPTFEFHCHPVSQPPSPSILHQVCHHSRRKNS